MSSKRSSEIKTFSFVDTEENLIPSYSLTHVESRLGMASIALSQFFSKPHFPPPVLYKARDGGLQK